ncbi:MAG: extracellular solute-binding protein [Oscillospiraceae bacterium]|nr:extracellular solute-binding protein [Oscillospiraceae bacterium]
MKKIIALLLVLAMALSLAACGGKTEAPAETQAQAAAPAETQAAGPEAITLKVWAPQVDQETEESWLPVMLAKFEEAHPEYAITWDIGVCGEGDAAGIVKNDPSAAADVYFYANDQMGTLIEAGALAKLGGSYLESVKANFAQTHVDLLTYTDGGVYGFPTAPNTWFMWYNKSVFSEEDIKSLNTMLEKGVVSFPMDNSWYTGTFFFGVGGTVFGPQGIDAAAGIDFSSDLCTEAAKFMVDMAKSPNFVNDVDGAGVAGMNEGTIHAMFSGDWDEPNLASLGENLGCAVLPTFTLADGSTYQMKSFASNKAVGVNPNAKNPKAAMQLAEFLTSADSLALRHELSGYIPAANGVQVDSATVSVVNAQMAAATIAQPVLAEMSNFWDPVKNFGLNILNGTITHDNAAEMIAKTMELLNSTGL